MFQLISKRVNMRCLYNLENLMKIKVKANHITSKLISNIWEKLEQVSFDFTFKNGKSTHLTDEVYGKGNEVAILMFNTATKKVVLSEQFRMPVFAKGIKDIFSMEVYGSAFDENELSETTVIREIQEGNNRFRSVIRRCFKKD